INIRGPGANDIPVDSNIEIVNDFDPTGGEQKYLLLSLILPLT
ncbi:18276_t:CDS:1, partial [Gigaspora rosea]